MELAKDWPRRSGDLKEAVSGGGGLEVLVQLVTISRWNCVMKSEEGGVCTNIVRGVRPRPVGGSVVHGDPASMWTRS